MTAQIDIERLRMRAQARLKPDGHVGVQCALNPTPSPDGRSCRSQAALGGLIGLGLLLTGVAAHAQDTGVPRLAVTAVTQVIETPAPVPPTPRHTGIRATFKALPHDFKH